MLEFQHNNLKVDGHMAKSMKRERIAWLLALTTGVAGGHNFYLGRYAAGATQLALGLAAAVRYRWLFVLVAAWLLLDLLFLNKLVEGANRGVAHGDADAETQLATQLAAGPDTAPAPLDPRGPINVNEYHADPRNHAAAMRMYLKELAALPKGQASNEALRLLNNLAHLYGRMGKAMEAELAYGKAVVMGRKIADVDTTLFTNTLNNYASTLMDRKAWDSSRELYREALAVQQAACKGISREAATSHNDLGVMAEKLGDLATAQKHHARALLLKQICVPDDLLDIARSQHSLGGVYFARRNFAEAGRLVGQLVTTYTRVLGASDPKTVQARANLEALPPEFRPEV